MDGIKIQVTGNIAKVTEKPKRIVAGTVGLPVEFTFDSVWDDVVKTAVFLAGNRVYSVNEIDDSTTVPWEVLQEPGPRLVVGVYGESADGKEVIPTIWAEVSHIMFGAGLSGNPSDPSAAPIWQKLRNEMADVHEMVEDGYISNASINKDGELELTFMDGSVVNVGRIVNIVDNLGSSDPNAALSARMGGVLKTKIEDDVSALNEQLQPQINQRVKTVNGVAPDENGNVVVEDGSGSSGVHIFRSDEEVDFTALVEACASGEPVYWYDVPSMVMYPAINCEPGYPRVVFGFVDHYNTLNLVVVVDGFGVEYRNVELVTEDKVTSAISQHNTDTGSHADIRAQITRVEGAIPTDTYINTLIDAKLGVIENGTY